MIYKFTKKAENVIDYANEIACKLGHNYVYNIVNDRVLDTQIFGPI